MSDEEQHEEPTPSELLLDAVMGVRESLDKICALGERVVALLEELAPVEGDEPPAPSSALATRGAPLSPTPPRCDHEWGVLGTMPGTGDVMQCTKCGTHAFRPGGRGRIVT